MANADKKATNVNWDDIFNMSNEAALMILNKMGIGDLSKSLERFKKAGMLPKEGSETQVKIAQNVALLKAYEVLRNKVESDAKENRDAN